MRRFQVPGQSYQSIRKGKNYRRIVNHQNYNPRIIEYAAWRYRDAGAPEGFFDFLMDKLETPKNVWKEEFERRMDRVDRYFMYTLYSLTSVKARVEYDHLEKAFRKVLEVIEADISVDQFENTLARLSRSLVRIVSDNKKRSTPGNPIIPIMSAERTGERSRYSIHLSTIICRRSSRRASCEVSSKPMRTIWSRSFRCVRQKRK